MYYKNMQAFTGLLDLNFMKTQILLTRSYSKAKTANNLSYYHHIGKEPLVYRTLGHQLEISADKFPNEAVVSLHENKRYTFKQLLPEVDRVAAGLLKLGLKRGDHVALWGSNNIHWYLSMLGAARAGLVSVAINPNFQATEIAYCLNMSKCKAVITPEKFKRQNFYEILNRICPELSHSTTGKIKSTNLPHLNCVIIDSNNKPKGTLSFDEVRDLGSPADITDISKKHSYIIPDTACNIQFTSGTTGHPKAALLTHHNIVNNGLHVGARNQIAGERICVQVPLFHVFGVVVAISGALAHGATLVFPSDGYSPKASLQAIVKEKCSIIYGTPTMYVDLVNTQKELNLPLKTPRMAVTGGAPCAPQLLLDIKNTLGVQRIHNVFGMTETTAVVFQTKPADSLDQILHTVGHVQDHVEVKVIDNEGNVVPFGTSGELCVRGYCNMLEYYENEDKTKETIGNDRWLRTGDQFMLREDGYGIIIGRLKDMIIRGGENIFPKEIEDFLSAHPDILEVFVVGVPDQRMGEELCAFVRLRDNEAKLDQDTLRQYCQDKIANFKIPRYLIITKELPKTTSGKIQKFKLKEAFLKEYANIQ